MSAWVGTNGAAPKGAKQTTKDVEAYFKINDVKKLVNGAVNIIAAERPADFKAGLCAALLRSDLFSASNKMAAMTEAVTKEEALAASEYLTSNSAEAVLSVALSKLAVAMPANIQAALAEYVKDATVPPPAAPKPAATNKPPPAAKSAEPPKGSEAPKSVPATAAAKKDEAPAGVDVKKWKAAVKEGGKKGVELAGCADMGGLEFFTTQIESAEGDLVLLQAAMDAANKDVDPADEEAKGGSGMVGKMLLSSGDKQLALLCYVPPDKQAKAKASEWMAGVVASCGGEVVSGDALIAAGRVVSDGSTRFALKDKDTCQAASVAWLKERGLFPQAQDDDDDWVPPEDSGVEW